MGARSSKITEQNNRSDGHLLEYFRNTFIRGGGGTNAPTELPEGLTATGGVISDYSDPGPGAVYRAHIFTSSGTFDVSAIGDYPADVDYLVVAGGGAGGNARTGGGGGAGGFRTSTETPISVAPYTVTVGAGGALGANGSPSTFGSTTSQGGGRGATDPDYFGPTRGTGFPGGSGGGSRSNSPGAVGGAGNSVVGTSTPAPTQGNPGGSTASLSGGGGGGASAAGGQGEPSGPADGGNGLSNVYAYGPTNPVTYAGGGGGGQSEPLSGGNPGGSGGGGTGQGGPGTPAATSGEPATGGGGGGTGPGPDPGGSGGSGIVVVRYQIGQLTASAKATGGAISYYDSKTIHTFTSSGDFNVTDGPLSVEYVMVGGGGAGGYNYAGGGGAGGYLTATGLTVNPGPNAVSIGAGGNGVGSGGRGGNGANTTFKGITAYGGGGGGYFNGGGPDGSDGTPGASGGGAGGSNQYQTVAGTGNRVAGTTTPIPAQGNPGAQGYAPQYYSTGGSGGGAGAAAAAPFPNGGSGHDASPGGIGLQAPPSFRNPAASYGTPGPGGAYYFAGGGGAEHTHGSGAQVLGGAGGGGGGGYPGGPQEQGTTNTGGGGGAGRTSPPGYSGNGGSGILIIAYPS